MRYRRVLVSNATYFFTVNLQNRKSNLLVRRIDALRFAFRKIQQRHPFYIDAIVILPDHFHMIMTLPEGDLNYSTRVSLIKATFSRQINSVETISPSRKNKRERGGTGSTSSETQQIMNVMSIISISTQSSMVMRLTLVIGNTRVFIVLSIRIL
ncbi:REP-associated tyrosine transposase [Legionella maioricensis]|uniref:Transposase n=1 Tax=Legionella maioricensis TaxID=2896528 RepID=A0A9X2IC51_9GAMM|nr:transposase [Legionella maioricensis]MCL9684891.1 transposase [Legionella maioricensis]MCL9689290.1 transposase [Legionella maioricensis]